MGRPRSTGPCSVDDCFVGVKARGLCAKHYSALRRKHGTNAKTCTEHRCDKPVHATGRCVNHYMKSKQYWKNRVRRKTVEIKCKRCSRPHYVRTGSPTVFCSLKCAKQRDDVKSLVLYSGPKFIRQPKLNLNPIPKSKRKFKSGQCIVCCSWFLTLGTDITCSIGCQEEHSKNMKRQARDRRRSRKRNAFVSNVYRKAVFENDKYRCHICRRKTDPTKSVPHPKAPTIDHVIPLACGGTHEPSNCRTACFICNATKAHHGGGEQLLLIS